MQTPLLPSSTFPGFDPDVPPVQNWYYVMVQNGPNEGPFWQWAKNAKNKTKNASSITSSKATLWEWSLVYSKWNRILWYMPGEENPYTHGDYGFNGGQSQAPQVDPTSLSDDTGGTGVIEKGEESSFLPIVIFGGLALGVGYLVFSKR